MPSPSLPLHHYQLVFHRSLYSSATLKLISSPSIVSNFPKPNPINVVVSQNQKFVPQGRRPVEVVKGKKENVWSVENELAAKSKDRRNALKMQRERRVLRRKKKKKKGSNDGRDIVMVSVAMLMEVETVLQTQEPVIKPAWNTFASSVSGIWKGVGAVFSPITAEMEPVEIGNKNENLYDCYTCSRIEVVPSAVGGKTSQMQRKTNWVTVNPYGEM